MQQEDEPYERPSKSAAKREAQALQELGEALIAMPDAQLDALPLPEIVRDAVLAARRITSRGALVRQRQLIGKLMRKIDVTPIREAIGKQEEAQRGDARRFKRMEAWRDRMLREGEPAIVEFSAAFPHADGAEVRRLVNAARAEAAQQRPPKSARLLFQLVREASAAG
jgi:ribosome-associated protein